MIDQIRVDLSNLSDVVKNDVVKKDVYNAKINNIEDKIPDITNLATNTTLNAKITEVKNEIPNITNLATTTVPNAVENEIPNDSNLVKKKTVYNAKISEIENKMTTDHDHDKYITTQEFNKLSAKNFTARLAEANLVSINDFANLINEINFDNKLKILNKNVTSKKIELNELSENVKAISTIGLTKDLINQFSILHVAKKISSGIFQNYLYQLKNTLRILVALLGLISVNLMENVRRKYLNYN